MKHNFYLHSLLSRNNPLDLSSCKFLQASPQESTADGSPFCFSQNLSGVLALCHNFSKGNEALREDRRHIFLSSNFLRDLFQVAQESVQGRNTSKRQLSNPNDRSNFLESRNPFEILSHAALGITSGNYICWPLDWWKPFMLPALSQSTPEDTPVRTATGLAVLRSI
jgi:hypothetical protein